MRSIDAQDLTRYLPALLRTLLDRQIHIVLVIPDADLHEPSHS